MSINSKKIAQNTIILYLRMLVLLLVSLYPSRVVLDVLGIEDYGIYNVVGGIVMLLGFLNGTMSTASSRYITVALSEGKISRMKDVFSSILVINIVLSIIMVLVAETIGLWFFYNKMQIPNERLVAAFWVYQISIITVVLSIVSVPYNAAIIAHEKMKAFAYITMSDAFGKLLMVYIIQWIAFDRLIVYAICMFLIQLIDRLIFGFYCKRHFEEVHVKWTFDRNLLKDMMAFISWSSYGSFATVGFTHGLNILLNMFFGPAINAARGIAVQIQSNVVAFTTNFQTAINPQLTKSTAQEDFESTRKLLLSSSKYSFCLLCMLGLPILAETHFILAIWLKEVPDYTVSFVRITLLISIWGSLANPLRVINQAEGHIRKFQLYECTLLLMIVPLSYIALRTWHIPVLVFVIHFMIECLAHIIRLRIVLPKIGMKICEYFRVLYIKLIGLFLSLIVISIAFNLFFLECIGRFFLSSICLEFFLLICIYKMILSKKEKLYMRTQIIKKIKNSVFVNK